MKIDMKAPEGHPIVDMLDIAVPLRIMLLEDKGGATQEDFDRLKGFAERLGSKGDVLLYGGKPGEAAELFNEVSQAIAVLSYCPGGIKLFGRHWETRKDEPEEPEDDAAA